MSVAVAYDRDHGVACLYCTTTDTAFGPTFFTDYEAEEFLDWLKANPRLRRPVIGDGTDPRDYSAADLGAVVEQWKQTTC